jgi:hypothetical protein
VLLCWCGAASRGGRRPPFIGGGGGFGKGDIFSGEVAGELGELRELRPAMRRLGWSACAVVRQGIGLVVQAWGGLRSAGGGDGSGRGGVNGAGRVGWLRRPARRGPAVA